MSRRSHLAALLLALPVAASCAPAAICHPGGGGRSEHTVNDGASSRRPHSDLPAPALPIGTITEASPVEARMDLDPPWSIFDSTNACRVILSCSPECLVGGVVDPIESMWTPDAASVEVIDVKLGAMLAHGAPELPPGFTGGFQVDDYLRQYAGVTSGNRRFVYIHGFAKSLLKDILSAVASHGGTFNWRTDHAPICDGGTLVFDAAYDVDAAHFTALRFNGWWPSPTDQAREILNKSFQEVGPERLRLLAEAARLYDQNLRASPAGEWAPEAALNGAYAYHETGDLDAEIALLSLFVNVYGAPERLQLLKNGAPRKEALKYTALALVNLATVYEKKHDFEEAGKRWLARAELDDEARDDQRTAACAAIAALNRARAAKLLVRAQKTARQVGAGSCPIEN